MVQTPEEAQFLLWREHPETVRFFRFLKDKKQEAMESWAKRKFVGDSIEVSVACNAEALGSVAVLQDLLDLTNQDIEDFYRERNEEYVRNSPAGQ